MSLQFLNTLRQHYEQPYSKLFETTNLFKIDTQRQVEESVGQVKNGIQLAIEGVYAGWTNKTVRSEKTRTAEQSRAL